MGRFVIADIKLDIVTIMLIAVYAPTRGYGREHIVFMKISVRSWRLFHWRS